MTEYELLYKKVDDLLNKLGVTVSETGTLILECVHADMPPEEMETLAQNLIELGEQLQAALDNKKMLLTLAPT